MSPADPEKTKAALGWCIMQLRAAIDRKDYLTRSFEEIVATAKRNAERAA